jgi:(3,5-dihydroxyphenyl)acetyl-CoA 1,2-dioxygenase
VKPASAGQWDVGAAYDELTDGGRELLRVGELVARAAEGFPGLLPSATAMEAERRLPQREKAGLELEHGAFVAAVLADAAAGTHLVAAMSQPTADARRRLGELRRLGVVDLGPIRVDRAGAVGRVTVQAHASLNAEDDDTVAALETAVDLVLLDDGIEVGVLRGGPATHPKYAGRRVLGSGIDLTRLYHGEISFVGFMIERELGALGKMYRGHDLGAPEQVGSDELRREKPWIVAVDTFAIGGACQWLLVADRVVAERGSTFKLPAAQDGIIPGCAPLRLPRFVGDRAARQAIFAGRVFEAGRPGSELIADDVVASAEMDAAIEAAAAVLIEAGTTSILANRVAMRTAQEPVDTFRRYMATYARQQASCLYSPAMIANLERNWDAARRRTG